jgi:hypothetical protein
MVKKLEYSKSKMKKFRTENPLSNSFLSINSRRRTDGKPLLKLKDFEEYINFCFKAGLTKSLHLRPRGFSSRFSIDVFLKLKKQNLLVLDDK